MQKNYEYYKNIFKNQPLPFAYVDMDLLDQNIQNIVVRAREKKVRIHSKAIRSVPILKHILQSHEKFSGIMCYHPLEAVYLSSKNLDDLLVAYPVIQKTQIETVCAELKKNKRIILCFDSAEHLNLYQKIAGEQNVQLPVCLDLDMTTKFPFLHFGSHWSSVDTPAKVMTICKTIKECKNLKLVGVLAYEGQIAGLPDHLPGHFLLNGAARILKGISIKKIKKFRKSIMGILGNEGFKIEFVNGGGTMSLSSTAIDPIVTEVSPGSGFFSPVLFDYYAEYKHLPAAGYAVEVTRKNEKYLVCQGGGFNAPGVADKFKQPKIYLPEKLKLSHTEGAGEVQTPLFYPKSMNLQLGDPIFFRLSTSGELCERFMKLHLVSQGRITQTITTYRGDGMVF